MKNLFKAFPILGIATFSLFFNSCSKVDDAGFANVPDGMKSVSYKTNAEYCGQTSVVNFIAGQHINVGSVSVANDKDSIYVTYTTTGDWRMRQLHLYVGKCNKLPINKSGNPVPGQFPFKKGFGGYNATKYTFSFPKAAFDNCFCVAAHAEVAKANGSGAETAWGQGTRFVAKGNWGMYFSACKQTCVDPCAPKPVEGCAYSPNSLFDSEGPQYNSWGTSNLLVGGYSYTKNEITDIYAISATSNYSWKGFIAVATIKASGSTVAADASVLCNVAIVEAYLASIGKVSANNLPAQVPSNIQSAIDAIEVWIVSKSC